MIELGANALTAIRVACAPLLAFCVLAEPSWPTRLAAPILFTIAARTDYLDGPAARRAGKSSVVGRWFDNLADVGFILVVLTSYVALGLVPWWVPASIFAAFAYYALDSLRVRPAGAAPNLIASRVGHLGGIFNYVVVGIMVGNETLGLHILPRAFVMLCFLCVPAYSLAGMVARRFGS